MRGSRVLLCAAALFTSLTLASTPTANAQIVVGVRVPSIAIGIGVQPVCSYGYYGYAPYACAPYGYYGSGYFYNGIFLGMGPWANWGYGHGWGDHRFAGHGGGRYYGGDGRGIYRNVPGDRGHGYGNARAASVDRGRPDGGAVARNSGGGPARGVAGPARGGDGPARSGRGQLPVTVVPAQFAAEALLAAAVAAQHVAAVEDQHVVAASIANRLLTA